jgi:hypothetical protein
MASVARRCLSMVSVGDNSHWSPREDKGWLDPGVGWVGGGLPHSELPYRGWIREARWYLVLKGGTVG